jgi:hypothetical protein
MPNKTKSRCAPAVWGPIENPIDKETLELWRRLDPDVQGQSVFLVGPNEAEDGFTFTEDVSTEGNGE